MNRPERVENLATKTSLAVREVAGSLEAARQFLFSLQQPDGHWVGELEADTSLESDYIVMQHFLGQPDAGKIGKLARYLLEKQLPDGGWAVYEGGPANLSLIVKAYFGLKLAGYSPEQPELVRAREMALELGGIQQANSFTKLYLAFLGQYDWDAVPAIPPELILLPESAYFSIYQMSSWSRSILVPLSVVWAHRPVKSVPEGAGVEELFLGGRQNLHMMRDPATVTWRNTFLALDRLAKRLEGTRFRPLRNKAIREAERWLLQRLESSDGLGAIYPAMMNAIFALDCLGYDPTHPVFRKATAEFERLEIEEGKTLRMQPCLSPVWDSAISHYVLAFSGVSPCEPGMVSATDWLLDKQVLDGGDWQVKNPTAAPGGWCFEYSNPFYPDIDDTAMVLLSLSGAQASDPGRLLEARRRGLAWLLSMQGDDGGFAAFDVNNNHAIYSQVPFADHNAMLDPSCPDITGRALEAMAAHGIRTGHRPVDRAIEYLKRVQEPEGCWFGRWGVNYIYGTCFALRGLRAAGEDMHEGYVIRAVEWLRSVQNLDGGWGESCASYDDPDAKGIGPSTASQTAWALLGLFAFGDFRSVSVQRGIEFLLSNQTAEGTWDEPYYTGTGFPRVFYLRYHLYRHYFPLLCLAEYARNAGLNSIASRHGKAFPN